MKCGLELHQRLAAHKLFCGCPSAIEEGEKPSRQIARRQHAVWSEEGESDESAMFEAGRGRRYIYQIFDRCVCQVDVDEAPPMPLNPEALEIALQVSLMLNCEIVDEAQVMRKQVLDGSCPSGFQRTAVVGLGGFVGTSAGKVRITSVSLEEESSGIVGESIEGITYRLDRLGIPLVEISTEPDIVSAEHARECAEKIGMMLRMTGRVQRGIGTIRQDVNVSSENGARVEIKGAQELGGIALLVQNEIQRQERLLAIAGEQKKRLGEGFELPQTVYDVSEIFSETGCGMVKKGREKGAHVLAIKLPSHAGLLGMELYENRRFGSELSDYAKSAGVRGILHSDEPLDEYGISEEEVEELSAAMDVKEGDAFVLCVDVPRKARDALFRARARAMRTDVPGETRRAIEGGRSAFLRPLAGRARMYPETDIPPIRIGRGMVEGMRKKRVAAPEEKLSELQGILNSEMAGKMLKSQNLAVFEKITGMGIEPMLAAATVENTLTALRREGVEIRDVGGILADLFSNYKKGLFAKAAIPEILKAMAAGKGAAGAVEELGLRKISGKELENIVKECNFDMKEVMRKYRLRVESDEVQRAIAKG